jgi:phage antirepressor YoqD-like protein
MTYINESGLYSLILSSKLDSAKRFKHWVTSEVLPSIRKQGGYMVARPDESDEVIMARALQIMQATLQRRDEQIAQLKPRADYADHVLDSISCFTVTQIGKELGMTGHDLNVLLCSHKIQYVQSGQYLLYADYARQGLAKNRNFEYHTAEGELKTRTYLVWTERGRDFIHRLVDKELAN